MLILSASVFVWIPEACSDRLVDTQRIRAKTKSELPVRDALLGTIVMTLTALLQAVNPNIRIRPTLNCHHWVTSASLGEVVQTNSETYRCGVFSI